MLNVNSGRYIFEGRRISLIISECVMSVSLRDFAASILTLSHKLSKL